MYTGYQNYASYLHQDLPYNFQQGPYKQRSITSEYTASSSQFGTPQISENFINPEESNVLNKQMDDIDSV